MNIFKKVLAVVAASAAFVTSAQASEINVGGVVFDPDYNVGVEEDFIGLFNFTQWFAPTATAVGNLGNYNSAVTIATVLGSLGGSGATPYFLQGAGKFNQINDSSKSFITGFGGVNSFCPGCQLTYAFGGIGLNKDNTFDVSQAWGQIYVDSTTNFNTPVGSQATANKAIDGEVWLDFGFQSIALAQGNVANGLISAVIDVVGGTAAYHFAPKTLVYSGSAFFPLLSSKVSVGGNGQVTGNSIPEPGTLAVLGLGLLGLAISRRRNSAI